MPWAIDFRSRSAGLARAGVILAVTGLALAGCSRELILPGDRFDTRTPLEATFDAANSLGDATAPVEVVATAPRAAVPIRLPATRASTEWTHRNGDTQHVAGHPALGSPLSAIWATDIGAGDGRKHRISAAPVAGGGRIYTLDSRATVTAVDAASGQAVWSRDLTPTGDREDDASGGGLAYADGTLYVTTGFGRLHAIDAASGAPRWEQMLEAPTTTAPTVSGGRVYVVSNDAVARAIDTRNGKILWTLPGAPNITSVVGGAGPALSGRNVILPLPSGEIVAALRQTGIRVWNSSVSGERLGRAYTIFTGVTADPVIVGDTIYVGSPTGRLVALDAADGERIWTAREGAYGPVWPAGDSLFLVSDEARLVRLNARTGETIWAEQMPYFVNDRPRRHRAITAHFGPVLAGGRLLVASDDGLIRGFDPASGQMIESVEIPGGAASAPIVVNGVAYVLSTRGVLHAYR